SKPVKGMLTGPVTILAWSFVRDDQPLADTARQVALALRDEVADLERAGIRHIQVDEAALRELLPLRRQDRQAYLDWAIGAFRLATSGVGASTTVHTHMCYSEFGRIVGAIEALDADVTSVEAARSHMELVDDLERAGYRRGIGPGVYDIHSPRVPSVEESEESLRRALRAGPAARLGANPHCVPDARRLPGGRRAGQAEGARAEARAPAACAGAAWRHGGRVRRRSGSATRCPGRSSCSRRRRTSAAPERSSGRRRRCSR